MQIVIEIPEEEYEKNKKNRCDYHTLCTAIKNGTPLPKNHGDLIDRIALSDNIKNRLIQTAMNNMETIMPYSKVCTDIVDNRIDTWIDEVKTIIEADGGDE